MNANAELGSDVCLSHQVSLGTAFPQKDAPVLGDRVYVGVKASIIGGVAVGDDVLVGAHALVTKSVLSNHVAVGVPATSKPRS